MQNLAFILHIMDMRCKNRTLDRVFVHKKTFFSLLCIRAIFDAGMIIILMHMMSEL